MERDLKYFEQWSSKWWKTVRNIDSEKERTDKNKKRWLWLDLLADKCRSYAITIDVQVRYFKFHGHRDTSPLKSRHGRNKEISIRRKFPKQLKTNHLTTKQ